MASNGSQSKGPDGPVTLNATHQDLAAATGSQDADLTLAQLNQVMGALWLPAGASEETNIRTARSALAALKGLAPRDELEGMLASQMVATHHAAMECLSRAMIPDQTFDGREQNLKHATKLLGVYARQVEALDKHRGHGQQKITVEHVNVHAGGQAIVGNVEAGAAGSRPVSAPPLAIANSPGPLAPAIYMVGTVKKKPTKR